MTNTKGLSESAQPLLVVEDLVKDYAGPGGAGSTVEVLRGVSFSMSAGQTAAVTGPSGSGKSTLLSILGSLEPATSGRVLLDGEDPAALSEPQLAAFRRRKIGFVFQEHYLLPQCTVLENVLVPTVAAGVTTAEHLDRAQQLLARVGLEGRVSHRPAELSGGERQRAALARALLLRPTLLLADEPTGNLDRTTAESVGRLLIELQQQESLMLIVATHSPALAATMQRVWELDGVRLVDRSATS